MKIENAEVFSLHNYILVKLTSDDGDVGWGLGFPGAGALGALAAVELTRTLKRISEVTIERAFGELTRACGRLGMSGAPMYALSAIDIALHDLMGNRLGVPISTLLGGARFDKMPIYSSPQMHHVEYDVIIRHVEEILAQGFTSVKLHTGATYFDGDVAENTIGWVKTLRDRWPTRSDLGIMVDVNTSFTSADAIRVGRLLEDLDVTWFEEPISNIDCDGYRKLQAVLDIPVAAGELNSTFTQFVDSAVRYEVDILQPNLTKCGGFSVGRRIASLAEAFNKPIASHNNEPTLMTAIHVQYWMATQMCEMPQEYCYDGIRPLRDTSPLLITEIEIKDGYAIAPKGPGLGVQINEEIVRSKGTFFPAS